MKTLRGLIFLLPCILFVVSGYAQHTIRVHNGGNVVYSNGTTSTDSLAFFSGMNSMMLFDENAQNPVFSTDNIDSITFLSGEYSHDADVYIVYNNDTAYVSTSISNENFIVSVEGADVSITTTAELSDINYYLSGSSGNGSLLLSSDKKFNLYLNSLNLTSQTTIPIKLSKNKKASVYLLGENILTDNATSSGKAVINSKGEACFYGSGSLTINALKKNGITSDNDIKLNGGSITVNNSVDASKGLKCDTDIEINGATVVINPTGSIAWDTLGSGYDPTYCAGIGADGDFTMSSGSLTINIPSVNYGGRGIKVDGSITITGGTVDIVSASPGATYTDTTGTTDSYTSSCMKADGDINLLAGSITMSATGVGGKCVNADSFVRVGMEGADDGELILTASTSGEKFYVSGSGENADYANPKVIKSLGNMYIYSGTNTITSTVDGGEGFESKDTLFLKGGYNVIDTYDDGINAANHIQIDGGVTYSHGSNNDGIDANGTLTVTGGLTISVGTTAPEEGFDCDRNTFTITGGTIVGIGGSTSTPTASVCTQRSLIYSGLSSGSAICVVNASGDTILTFRIPVISNQGGGMNPGGGPGGNHGGGPGGNTGLTLLFSSPELTAGTYTFRYGGTITGGDNFNGYYTGADYTGGSTKSITISSMVNTVR